MRNNWYLTVLQKVNEANKLYAMLKKESYNVETLEKMEACRAIIAVWGTELNRLKSA